MAGNTPVTWQRPPAQTVTVTTDKDRYDPGDTATLIVQSPFQTGRALAVVEEPEGRFRYDWVDIANGFGRYAVPLRKAAGAAAGGALPADARPARHAGAAGRALRPGQARHAGRHRLGHGDPVDNRVNVSFDAPAEARPAQEFDLVLHLADAAGHPLSGEATVWMVDQAVLSLAKERRSTRCPPSSSTASHAWRRATPATWRSASSR